MNIAFVSYESPFAPCGGIAAVMARLPAQMAACTQTTTVCVTPFHHRIEKTQKLERHIEGSFGVPFDGKMIVMNIVRHDDKLPWYLLQPDDLTYFQGAPHPYAVGSEDLLRDCLLFGAAVPVALSLIAPGRRWHLLLQDWEAATVALTLGGLSTGHKSYLTLHNSYDCGVQESDLWRAHINPISSRGETVLQRTLPLVQPAIFTVSEQFASDMIEDTLQARVVAGHLKEPLTGRLVGVDNGPFTDLVPELAGVPAGDASGIQSYKAGHRATFRKALEAFVPTDEQPCWGNPKKFLATSSSLPWFILGGRDDPRQKGYDVACEAARRFLAEGHKAQFLFFPMPGDEGRVGLRFLEKLAAAHPEYVVAFPFAYRDAFMPALRGASFGLMPSLYEPFGMANEMYLNGTPAIGRATGGLLQQIVPLRAAGSFGRAVQVRANRWSKPDAAPTGLLFRERDGLRTEVDDWKALNEMPPATDPDGPDRIESRARLALFDSMADELRQTLIDAVGVSQKPALYERMLISGIQHIQQNFSWDRAAREYLRHMI